MGDHEGWAQPSGLLPNGLLSNESTFATRTLDQERWLKAEERTAELIACIQPNHPSEELRNAVADYVQRLIMKCFSCQVFTFGSVPLKTYLPDGDIDLTAFSKNQSLKDTWANEVCIMLENEEKSDNAEFRVKEVQYIQAEVKIIKCLVENIVVDISFNQLGGLCTLCFLEEVDHLINQNHLFKRSIILIKAWCYYESRILGAHHGLISTYALETLVLYIFHVFNNSFTGPLEVLYRFLEFFSNFDWDNFCVSLWGPIPISSLPDMTAESPRKDTGELLLSKLFLDACSSVYAVFPRGQENQGQPFVSKHFNVVDPLRTNNNLGRSVSKGNFFRIRSAFAFGAKRLTRLLDCPEADLIAEVNQFFMNTWERHGTGRRPDAPSTDLWRLRPTTADLLDGSENLKNYSNSKKLNENTGSSAKYESEVEDTLYGISSQHGDHPSESTFKASHVSAVSRTQSQKNYGNIISSRVSDQVARPISSNESIHTEKVQKSSRPDYLANEVQARYQFARTRSSPELSDTSSDVSRGRRNKAPETVKNRTAVVRPDYSSRRKNGGSEVSGSHSARSSTDDPSSLRHSSSQQSLDTAAADSNNASNSYHDEASINAMGEELASVAESMEMHQEEQDLVNMMASSGVHGFPGQLQMPMNLAAPHLPFPISPSILASMGYAQRNLAGMIPINVPLIEPRWGTNMQFPQGMVSLPLSHYYPSIGLPSNPEDTVESGNETSVLREINQEDGDHGFWREQDAGSARGFDSDNGNFPMLQSDDKQQSTSVGFNFVPSRPSSSGSSFTRDQQKFVKENRGSAREDRTDTFRYQNNRRNEVYTAERSENLRFLPTSHASSSKNKVFSESSWDGSSAKVSKSIRDKKGRRPVSSVVPSSMLGKGKTGWQYDSASVDHGSSQADDDNSEWIPLSRIGSEMAERSMETTSVASVHRSHHVPSYESAQMSGSDSVISIAPMFLGSGSRHRAMDNSGPFAFYPTGPPVPFLRLPVYNLPTEAGNSEGSTNHFDREEAQGTSRTNQSDLNPDSADILDQSDTFSSSHSIKGASSLEPSEEHKSDILHSDFASHWQNLQFGRLCQNPCYHGPLVYPSPVAVPPAYLQGHFPWDGPGRPVSGNVNLITQLMSYGPRPVPVTLLQPGSNRPTGVFQRYSDEVPRYRGGTGTYLPNPKVPFRDRQPSSTKNHRGNYNYDRNDHHGDREGNWNSNSKPRAAGRSHGRNQADKPSSRSDRPVASDSRANRPWDSHRHDSFPSYQSQTGPFGSTNSLHSGSTNVSYGMYPLSALSSNGVTPTGPAVPSVVMFYSYDHNGGYGSPAEQLEFGSLGPVHFPGINDVSHLAEGGPVRGVYEQQRFRGGSSAHSSPDQPSSPQLQRSAGQRNYQLKDEDFPPLSFPNQGGNDGGNNYNGKPSHYQTFLLTPQS